MPRILPFLLLGCLLFLFIQAETVHAREASPLEFALGQALRPLISQDPTQLSDPSLLKAAEAALLAERPLLAEWILHSVKDEAGGPLIDYLQFEVFRQLGDTQAAYEMLDAHLGTWPAREVCRGRLGCAYRPTLRLAVGAGRFGGRLAVDRGAERTGSCVVTNDQTLVALAGLQRTVTRPFAGNWQRSTVNTIRLFYGFWPKFPLMSAVSICRWHTPCGCGV